MLKSFKQAEAFRTSLEKYLLRRLMAPKLYNFYENQQKIYKSIMKMLNFWNQLSYSKYDNYQTLMNFWGLTTSISFINIIIKCGKIVCMYVCVCMCVCVCVYLCYSV